MRIRPSRAKGTGKYGAVREGGFDSRKEKRRHAELLLLQKAGEIRGLERQVPFRLLVADPKGSPVPARYDGSNRRATYRADFTYEELDRSGEWIKVIEDVKGQDTPLSKLKRTIVATNTGIPVRLT